MLEIGRICVKIAGREAGRYCVVIDDVKDNFAFITGPKRITGVRRRKCNVFHLEPTQEKLNIEKSADDSVIEDAWKNSGLIEKFGIEIPKKFKEKKEKKERPRKIRGRKRKPEKKKSEKPKEPHRKKEEKPKEEKK